MFHVHGEQPFWFWNDQVEKGEVRRQIAAMKDGGAKGFFLHPRQGLKLPYMSNHFLDTVKSAVEAAKDLDMEMWLYDEYPYPSGVSGGEVLDNPNYRAHFLHPYCFTGSGLFKEDLRWGTVLYAKAFPVLKGKVDWSAPVDLTEDIGIIYLRDVFQGSTGLSSYSRKRYFTGEHAKQLYWNAPEGEWKVFIFIDHEMDDFKYFGCFVDPLNKEAIEYYIKTTHERYKKAFGEEFGKTVKGIFTDETSPMGTHGILWSRLMPQLFEARNGYSLIDFLPALLEDMDIDNQKFLYDFNATCYESFVESYDKPIRAWCDANNLIYTGEKPHLRLEQCSFMTLAGTDNGHVKCGKEPTQFPSHYRANARAVSSSNHFCGNNVTLCEAYHSLGWDVTLRDMRWMVDWLGIDGINLFVPHAFYYSENALRKHDAPPSMFENMPWWPYNTLYTDHIETTTKITQYGARRIRTLVLDPMFCAWGERETWGHRGRPKRGENTPLVRTQRALSQQHLDYYVIDRNLMEKAQFGEKGICLGGEYFDAVILPGMNILEKQSAEFVKNALSCGAKVFALDILPERCITDASELAFDKAAILLFEDETAMAKAAAKATDQPLSILENGEECKAVQASAFDLDGVTYIYSTNLYKEPRTVSVTIKNAAGPVSLIDTVTGEAAAIAACEENGAVSFTCTYAPFAPALFAIGKEGKAAPAPDCTVVLDPVKDRPFKMLNDNLLRLGKWEATLGRAQGTVKPMPVIDQLVALEGSIKTVEKSDFGCVKKLQFPEMALEYKQDFDLAIDCPLTFAMEPGALAGDFKLYINEADITDLLAVKRIYARGNLSCDITPYVRQGRNTVRVCVNAQMDHDGLVNALYIAGPFGCYLENGVWTLKEPAACGNVLDPIACGLPFFCGKLSYDLSEDFEKAEGLCGISIDDWMFEHACELKKDGVSLGARAWNPYHWLAKADGAFTLEVASTMLGAYEGCRFIPATHETVEIE